MVHRILTKIIDGTLTEEYISYLNAKLSDIAYDCSQKENGQKKRSGKRRKKNCAVYAKTQRDIFDE
jgi:hypothetical protein